MELQQEKKVICLEGIVGAGKTTQIKKLNEYFYPNSYLIPELNDISPMKEIREKLRTNGQIAHLIREDVEQIINARAKIQQELVQSTNKPLILMDRGIYTGMVFEAGNLSMSEVEVMSKKAGIIIPDICIILYCDTRIALERIDKRRIEVGKYTNRAFHETEDYINRTKEKYFEIAKNKGLKLIDTSNNEDEVKNKIIEEIYNAKIL